MQAMQMKYPTEPGSAIRAERTLIHADESTQWVRHHSMVASATRAVVTLLGLLGLLGLLAITLPVALAQGLAPNHPNQPSGAFLRQWLLCGPFSTQPTAVDVTNRPPTPGFNIDFLVAAGGERAIRPQAGQTVTHPAGKATWTLHEATNDAINLRAAVSTRSEVAAYAYCTVECDTDQNVIMAVGSNDGVSIWINGEEIWRHRAGRILKRDEDRIPVRLKGGRNAVLLKIDQWGGELGVCLPVPALRRDPNIGEVAALSDYRSRQPTPAFVLCWPKHDCRSAPAKRGDGGLRGLRAR